MNLMGCTFGKYLVAGVVAEVNKFFVVDPQFVAQEYGIMPGRR
jgi:hypothetical protein